ncbi:MAG TPA: hypothetical protein VH502_01445, partial [Actinoplanes sp.]
LPAIRHPPRDLGVVVALMSVPYVFVPTTTPRSPEEMNAAHTSRVSTGRRARSEAAAIAP